MSESVKELRVIFRSGNQKLFLNQIKTLLKIDDLDLANTLGLSRRTIYDWGREKYSIPFPAVKNLCKRAGIDIPHKIELKDRYWYTNGGGNAGGRAVLKKYGFIGGNPEYRKRRWHEWWESKGKYNKHSITSTLPIKIPRQSESLAEFIGIILGDGGISARQVTITLHKVDDRKYAEYVKNLITKLFNTVPSFYLSSKDNVIDIVVSRSTLVKYLVDMGLCIGSKVRHQVNVPLWIRNSEKFSSACLRGLFDTDGCFYVDRHIIKNKTYFNCGMNFTNRSLPLLNFFKSKLTEFGYSPTQKTKYGIFLRREYEIIKYFTKIGSRNLKYINRLEKFFKEKYGEVPKWS